MKCIHCGNETELGTLLPNGDRVYPLHYPLSVTQNYVDLVTSTSPDWGLGPDRIRLEVQMPYVVLNLPMLRQMIQDIENAKT
jgi:hypothetical protein